MRVYGFLPYTGYPTGGVGRYAFQVMNKLGVELFLYNSPFERKDGRISYLKNLPSPFLKRHLSTLLYYPIRLRNLDADVYHAFTEGSAYPLLVAKKAPLIVTFTDLIPWLYPRQMSGMTKMDVQLIKFAQRISTKADFIITISESTKNDLQRLLKVSSSKVKVIYLGVDKKFKVVGEKEEVRKRLGMEASFIFSIARARGPNIETLFMALYKLKKGALQYSRLKLYVNVSSLHANSSYMMRILSLRKRLNLERDVVFLQFVSDEDLIKLYNAADIFIFPSFYEGFGLPMLEAMACGTPVIASDTSSAPEILADAGIRITIGDADEMANAINKILTDENLRKALIRKGLSRAKKFDWEKTVKDTLKVYEQVSNGL